MSAVLRVRRFRHVVRRAETEILRKTPLFAVPGKTNKGLDENCSIGTYKRSRPWTEISGGLSLIVSLHKNEL